MAREKRVRKERNKLATLSCKKKRKEATFADVINGDVHINKAAR